MECILAFPCSHSVSIIILHFHKWMFHANIQKITICCFCAFQKKYESKRALLEVIKRRHILMFIYVYVYQGINNKTRDFSFISFSLVIFTENKKNKTNIVLIFSFFFLNVFYLKRYYYLAYFEELTTLTYLVKLILNMCQNYIKSK